MEEYQRKLKAYYKDDPTDLHYNMLMARCYRWSNSDLAYQYFDRIFKVDPTNTEARDALIDHYVRTKNHDQLIGIFDYLLQNNFSAAVRDPYLVPAYREANQLDKLFALYLGKLNQAMPSPGVLGEVQGWPSLEQGLKDANKEDELLAYYRLFIDNENTGNVNERIALINLLAAKGDKQGVGEACEKTLFPRPFQPPAALNAGGTTERIYDLWHVDYQFSLARVAGLIRTATAAGQIERLKTRAKAEIALHPDLAELRQTLLFIALYGHDPEAPDLLKDYFSSMPITDPGSRGPDIASDAILEEIGRWPEGHARCQEGLKSLFQHLAPPHPHVYWYSLVAYNQAARAALKINETEMARTVLGNGLEPTLSTDRTILQGVKVSNGDMPDFSVLSDTGRLLVQTGMRKELSLIIPMIADPSRSLQEVTPTSRSEEIANLGEEAFDAVWIPEAKLAAETAAKVLRDTWHNPGENYNGRYSQTITPNGIHLTFDLLVRLDLDDDFNALHSLLLQAVPPGSTLDQNTLLQDADKVRNTYGDHPTGLIPVAWLDSRKDDTLKGTVDWNVNATIPPSLRRGPRDFESFSPSEGPEDEVHSSFSVSIRDLPKLNGKFTMQILAGPSADNLRIVKSIPAANCQGKTSIDFQAGDKFIQALGQTNDAQPTMFTGPVMPVCLAPNLLSPATFHLRIADAPMPAVPIDPNSVPPLETIQGGPVSGGSYFALPQSVPGLPLELAGPIQNIKRGTTYVESGWFLCGNGIPTAQWGIRYFDQDGKKISDSFFASSSTIDGWHFDQFSIYTGGSQLSHHSYRVPENAVTFQPVLVLSAPDSSKIAWQGLYLGVLTQEPIPPDLDRTLVMKGLNGAIKIVEAPQGNLLAVAFQDGTIRCYDLQAKHEVGTAARLTGSPVDIAFFNHGEDIAAADVNGNITVRPVQDTEWDVIQTRIGRPSRGFPMAKMIYRAPWPIDALAASEDGCLLAVGNREVEHLGNAEADQAVVIDLSSGKEVRRIDTQELKLGDLCLSPSGKYLHCWGAPGSQTLWDVSSGECKLRKTWINPVALAHFFHTEYPIKTTSGGPVWIQTKRGFVVMGDNSSLTYTQVAAPTVIHRFDTGPIATFCPSTNSEGTYAIDGLGNLDIWTLPSGVKIPESIVSPEQENIFAGIAPDILQPPPPPPQLSIAAPSMMRGFPLTTLSIPLDLTVLDSYQHPVSGAKVNVSSNLEGAKFKVDGKTARSILESQTDNKGHASMIISLGKKVGHGTITVNVSYETLVQKLTIPLESIDENNALVDASDCSISSGGGNSIVSSWHDNSDGEETGFLIERHVQGGPWQTITILPENSVSYTDTTVDPFNYNYQYRITPINSSKYGYPPKLPPPPDRLGDFRP